MTNGTERRGHMESPVPNWAARVLCRLLGDGDAQALLGDLAEEYARRSASAGPRGASRWCRRQAYASLAASLRMRLADAARSVPWGVAGGAYVLVGIMGFACIQTLSSVWPGEAHATSVLRLVVEFPGIVCIAYLAARLRRGAPFVLAAMMFLVAALLSAVGSEVTSPAFTIAFLVVGPLAAVLGGLLHRGRGRVAW